MSFDDLCNNFKIVEQEVKRTASPSSSLSSQNMAFMPSPSSTNEVNTAYGVSTANTQVSPASTQVSTASTQVSTVNLSDATVYAFLANQPNGSQLVHEDLEQIHEDDLEEMDLKWQLALLSMRTRSYMADDEVPTNMDLMDFLASENEVIFCEQLAVLKRDISYKDSEISMLKSELEKLKQEKESNQLKIEIFDNAYKSLDKLIGSPITDKSRKGVGFVSYNVVPPPHPRLFLPLNLDLSYSSLEEFQQPKFEGYGPKPSKSVSEDISNKVRESPDAPLVEELVSDDKLEKKTGHPQKEDQGYLDNGCSRHMIGNMSYFSDFKEFDRGYVTFGEGAKGEKITADESQVLLKVPRKNNMYSVDMKNIDFKESLTFLVTKATLDESMLWLKRLENLVDKKVKIIICDNGTEFKNRVMSEFCEKKGIKKEFSIAITPQQNGVDERRIRTLIEAARTIGRTPALSFMRPFRCHVTILNTLDYLGKFDGKSNEGFFVGYSLNSKAFRVYNIKTRKVEENLHISDAGKKNDEGVCKESGIDDQERTSNSTQSVNIEPDMFSLGDNATLEATHVDFFGDETEVDMSNITTTYLIPSTPNTRIYKDHSLDHMIGEVQSGVQTRRMTKTTNEQWFISADYKGKTHEDLHTCLFACFLSQVEPKKKVWTLVDLPYGKRAIGTKWVYRNKKDERVARIEAIRLFLAYASFMTFVVYQMDVKNAFLYSKIEEEVYVCQPLGFEDPEFPDRVYKVEKALYGLHQAPRACQDKYVDETLKKFGFSTVMIASTPMETSKPLLKDAKTEDVDVYLYRSMIGSLMYLTASRPDIMFDICACARFQVTPKVSHLYAVKRIFRYLKGQPKLVLWYPKDSPFDLEAYLDSDYVGASLDRKSTTRGCQFLGSRLISWQCKKQTVVANSTTEAEYVAAANCCGQVLWIQNQMLDYGYNFMNTKIFINNENIICIVKNPVFHSKT
ncbi:putative ribonuclease H-like domain-containing protein [Tanacetum coccineum]|uniref:Ribonuclease H-like domain-containing protein n=1 Tax=Tanacetum coccineum TaxID=301880 RepID=A0ABQ5CXK0_9ASTR